jgi:hypothetical protein
METITIKTQSVDEAIRQANFHRRQNKNKWIVLDFPDFNAVGKTYDTYMQIFERDSVMHAFPMGLNVSGWKEELKKALTYVNSRL